MSRHPSRYMPSNIPISIPRTYYLQDDAEFSDNEMEPQFAWAEGQCGPGAQPEMHENLVQGHTPDVTELYRRKQEDQYLLSQEMVLSDEPRYYYRPAALARIPQRRLPIGLAPSHPASHPASHPVSHPSYYPPPPEEPNMNYEGVVYRSQPQLHRMDARPMTTANTGVVRRHHQIIEPTPQVSNMVRTVRPPNKSPVSVRTPRFFRRSNLIRRPSALCLQLPHSPDPCCRPMKGRAPTPAGLTSPPIGLRYPGHARQPMTARESLQARHATLESLRESRRELEERRALSSRSAPPGCAQERGEEGERVPHEDDLASNQGEPETKCSELELLLNQYEQIFSTEGNLSPPKTQDSSRKSSTKSAKAKRRNSISKIAGCMKPRLPPSLKNLQKQTSSKSSLKNHRSSSVEEDRIEIEQMTAEVLDNLLQDLSVSGLTANAANQTASQTSEIHVEKPETTRSKTETTPENNDASENKEPRRSRKSSRQDMRHRKCPEIENKSIKDQTRLSFDEVQTKTTFMQDKEKFNKFTNSSHTSFDQDKNLSWRPRDKTPVKNEENLKKSPFTNMKKNKSEDHAALELHRSKSYIVNLIDRALSRELGTIPEERTSKQYLDLDARTAMDMITSKNMDTDLCVEISQVIADSFVNSEQQTQNHVTPQTVNLPPQCCSKNADCARGDTNRAEGNLMFSTGNEEPLYIKQLKKLRWGHLKHIQREMRRLEDLERFLDSCSAEK